MTTLTATYTNPRTQEAHAVEIIEQVHSLFTIRTLDQSAIFVALTNEYGAQFQSSYTTCTRRHLTNIRRDGVALAAEEVYPNPNAAYSRMIENL